MVSLHLNFCFHSKYCLYGCISTSQLKNSSMERTVVSHLDPLGPVHKGPLLGVRVGAVHAVEGVALAEQVLLVQILSREV